MLLGPMAGVGFIHLLYRTLKEMMTYGTLSLPRLFMMLACLCSVLLSASRGAFLATAAASGYLFFMFLKDKPHQLLKTGVCLLLVSGAAYPLMGHFASGMISKQEANENRAEPFPPGKFYGTTENVNFWTPPFTESDSPPSALFPMPFPCVRGSLNQAPPTEPSSP